ncbi:hypothetical protein MaudCBS49596_003350 [Microsporum audouinii]
MPSISDIEHYDVAVVGAAVFLVIDDSKTIGGVWSEERIYPTLYAQICYPLFEYSFYPMKNENISPDGFISGTAIHNYLVSFARDHGLLGRTRLETRVVAVERGSNGSGWILEVNNGPLIEYNFHKPVIHSLDFGSWRHHIESDAVNRATVVGASKSSYDTVYNLLKSGKEIAWIIRKSNSGPFSLFAPTFMGLWHISDHISTRLAASFSPSIMNISGHWNMFLQRTAPGQFITRLYWQVATALASHLFWGSGGIGIATVPDFWQVIHNGDVTIHQTGIESLYHQDVVNLEDGFSVPADIVIHCTGFDKGYDTFSPELQDELGLRYDSSQFSKWTVLDSQAEAHIDQLLPILKNSPFDVLDGQRKHTQGPNRHYRRLVVPNLAAKGDRSILFPGHIHPAFTPLAAKLQALWGFAWMHGWLDLPSQEEMEREAAIFNAWTRKRYIEQGKKHSYFIYDYISYLDTLMRDLGLNPYRKKSAFAEWFMPYRPSDYRGVIDEYLASKPASEEKKKIKSHTLHGGQDGACGSMTNGD